MTIHVEPRDGHELDRLITALLNATGVVSRVIEHAGRRPYQDGVEVIDRAADRLRGALAFVAEHHSDDELALVVEILAEATVLTAEDLMTMGLSPFAREAQGNQRRGRTRGA